MQTIIEYTSQNGYVGVLKGSSTMQIFDKEGDEVFHTAFRSVNSLKELKEQVDKFPAFLHYYRIGVSNTERRNMSLVCVDPHGKIYNSEAEMARAHGVTPTAFNRRKIQGLPLKACLSPVSHPFGNDFMYKGKRYKSFRDCCVNLGLSYSCIYKRIMRKNISPEEALEQALKNDCKAS